MDVNEIQKWLPHRYPFLMVDRILEYVDGKSIVGIKNVTINEPYFQGHFPEYPVVPGVLVLEAMVQTGGILALMAISEQRPVAFFTGIDKAKFRRQVVPGDQMRMEVEVLRHRGSLWHFKGKTLVEGQLAAEAELQAMIAPRQD